MDSLKLRAVTFSCVRGGGGAFVMPLGAPERQAEIAALTVGQMRKSEHQLADGYLDPVGCVQASRMAERSNRPVGAGCAYDVLPIRAACGLVASS